jgi:glycosyl transferase, family 25
MQIYVINLGMDRERMRFMAAQLERLGLEHQRFSAVHHAHLTPEQQQYADAPLRKRMKKGEIGCTLSHLELWKTIVQGPDEHVLVLEDDVHLSPNVAQFLGALQLPAAEVCIHKLETFLARVTVRRDPSYTSGERVAKVLFTNHGGTGAYIVNKRTAALLLSLSGQFKNCIDVELFDPKRGAACMHVRVYQWLPAPCIQDMLIPRLSTLDAKLSAQGFVTRLPERMDDELFGRTPSVIEQVKSRLRPAVTLAQDAALRFSGRARAYVPFG